MTWMRVRGAPPLQVAVRATAMASTMSNAAIAVRTTAGYAPEQQRTAESGMQQDSYMNSTNCSKTQKDRGNSGHDVRQAVHQASRRTGAPADRRGRGTAPPRRPCTSGIGCGTPRCPRSRTWWQHSNTCHICASTYPARSA